MGDEDFPSVAVVRDCATPWFFNCGTLMPLNVIHCVLEKYRFLIVVKYDSNSLS